MSVETRNHAEFDRYLEYQRAARPQRIETLGGAATALVLATVDMGISDVRDPAHRTESRATMAEYGAGYAAEAVPPRAARERRLAAFATDAAELGYARVG